MIVLAENPPQTLAASVVAIGKFDGVHLGHQALIAQARERADELDLPLVVVTFDRNPLSVLSPQKCPVPLSSLDQRLMRFAASGVDYVRVLHFDAKLAALSAESFIEDVLCAQLGVRHVVLGTDFRFGNRGRGDADLLRDFGAANGFSVSVVSDVADAAQTRVSSTAIRDALSLGDIAKANELLGYEHVLRGEVVAGDRRGRELGFPTANLDAEVEGFVPEDGIYAAWVSVVGSADLQRVPAALSIGTNPTFAGERARRVEAFLMPEAVGINPVGDIYGQEIEVSIVARVRPTVAFAAVSDLVAQMKVDVENVLRLLKLAP